MAVHCSLSILALISFVTARFHLVGELFHFAPRAIEVASDAVVGETKEAH